MVFLAEVVGWLLLGFAVHQLLCAVVFAAKLFRYRSPRVADSDLPKAAVLLGLKGADPELSVSLARLMTQDYPDYEIRIVLDSRDDPAAEAVDEAVRKTGASRVHVEVFEPGRGMAAINSTNAKLMQSVRRLDDSIGVIAMADGDLVPHEGWLRELVVPLLSDPRVGATYGNRWFMPDRGRFGSMVRYLWNMVAVISMYFLGMPWGGCFAMRTEVLRKLGLRRAWDRVIAFDAATPGLLRAAGLRVRMVASLIMPNREECSVAFCLNFVRRQLTWTRLYHPLWTALVCQTLLTVLIPVSGVVVVVAGLLAGERAWWTWPAMSLGVYAIAMLAAWPVVEGAVRRMIRRQGRSTTWLTPGKILRLAVAVPVAQAIQLVAVLAAIFGRRVKWRGVTLEIVGPSDIRMVDYRPFRQSDQPADAQSSL